MDVPEDEYNEALDHMEGEVEEVEGEGEGAEVEAVDSVKALQLRDPPNQKTQLLLNQHPEIWPDYEVAVREKLNVAEFPPTGGAHSTYPFLTLYERAKILSLRVSQLAQGAPPFIEVPDHVVNNIEIATAELEAKRLPYILKRPLPDGEFEYWRLADLLVL